MKFGFNMSSMLLQIHSFFLLYRWYKTYIFETNSNMQKMLKNKTRLQIVLNI